MLRLNPFQTKLSMDERMMRFIVLVFVGISLHKVYQQLDFVEYLFTHREYPWDFQINLHLLGLMVVPAIVVLFWKRHRAGWYLLSVQVLLSFINSMVSFVFAQDSEPIGVWDPERDILVPDYNMETTPFDDTSFYFLLVSLFLGMTLWVLCRPKVREAFAIRALSMVIFLVFVAVAYSIFLFNYLG